VGQPLGQLDADAAAGLAATITAPFIANCKPLSITTLSCCLLAHKIDCKELLLGKPLHSRHF
jgi:hypothetical protein